MDKDSLDKKRAWIYSLDFASNWPLDQIFHIWRAGCKNGGWVFRNSELPCSSAVKLKLLWKIRFRLRYLHPRLQCLVQFPPSFRQYFSSTLIRPWEAADDKASSSGRTGPQCSSPAWDHCEHLGNKSVDGCPLPPSAFSSTNLLLSLSWTAK